MKCWYSNFGHCEFWHYRLEKQPWLMLVGHCNTWFLIQLYTMYIVVHMLSRYFNTGSSMAADAIWVVDLFLPTTWFLTKDMRYKKNLESHHSAVSNKLSFLPVLIIRISNLDFQPLINPNTNGNIICNGLSISSNTSGNKKNK